ncbi:MAG: alpha-glucosidase [Succinivibrio sp.]|nr:alpha-glucosidase [Succinivibrio sp.]
MQKLWWHGKVAYQIYPKSFKDSNGDGIGDIPGIISKLDYLKELGIDIIWLCPVYDSPFVDNGYDISDYKNIASVFGTMQDFDELLSKANSLGIKIIMDLVVNHCSSEHRLFRQALKDPYGPEAKYFYFVKGKNGQVPDNLRSYFGGSVWEKVPGQDDLYYLHYFAKQQPDLNWNNRELRQKVYDMINWWLDKGIAGFRVDAIMNVAKDPNFNGLPPDDKDGMCAANKMTAKLADQAIAILKELKKETFDRHQAFTVAEAFGLNPEIMENFVGEKACFSTIFDFTARENFEKFPGYYAYPKADIKLYRDSNFKMQELVNKVGFVAPILENHDEPRSVSFYLDQKQQTPDGAKALATAFMFLKGIPFIYQGQELGMTNTHFNDISEIDDLNSKDEYKKCLNHGMTEEEALDCINRQSRDHGRTPMLWDSSLNAGFSTGKPWLKVHQDYLTLNVEKQLKDPDSTLNYYKKLIALRKSPEFAECFTYGDFIKGDTSDPDVICYLRKTEQLTIKVIASFKDENIALHNENNAQILLSSNEYNLIDGNSLRIKALSAVVLKIAENN